MCSDTTRRRIKSLRAGSQVFTLLMLFLVILHTMWESKSLQLLHLTLWYVVLVYHQYDVCKNYVGSVYVGGSERNLP